MGFLFGNKNKEKLIAVFDIGSDSVGGAIVKIDSKNDVPKIIKSVRNEIAFYENNDIEVLLENMIKALSATANNLYNSKMGSFDEIMCMMASPWYLSENRVIKTSRENHFIFTKKMMDDLVKKEITNLKESYKKQYPDIDNSLELMENYIMSISLNGYKIDNPLNVSTKSVEMNVMVSLSSKNCLEEVRKSLSKVFHHTKISFSSFMMSSYLAVRDKYISPESYLLLDVGGEITEVGIVYKGVLMSSLSFPFGKKTFYRYICTKLDVELRDAKELLNMYLSNSLSQRRKEKVKPLFDSIEKSWGEAFRQCVNTLPHTLALPSTIFLTADPDIKDWFRDTIKKEEYAPSMITKYNPEVVTIDGGEFLSMCEVSGGLCDPFLMIGAISFFRKIENK
jgi:hypothetical protein